MRIVIFLLCTVLLYRCKNESKPGLGPIIIYDDSALAILDTLAPIETLDSGFVWSEGPVWSQDLNALLFTDVPENKIWQWSPQNGLNSYLSPSGYTMNNNGDGREGANGLAFWHDTLILCQHGDRRLATMTADIDQPQSLFNTIVSTYDNKKFNSPNDLHITPEGDIFFTDPPYGLPGQDHDPHKELSYNGVYCLKNNGDLLIIDSTLTRPNGIIYYHDSHTLIVANSDKSNAIWVKYTLDSLYNVLSKSTILDMTDKTNTLKGLPDGLKIHQKSKLIFATGPGGIHVFNTEGQLMASILLPDATANCAFDTDETYIYLTSHMYLKRLKLK